MRTEIGGRIVNNGSEVVTAPPLAVRYETLVRVSQAIGAHGDPKELFGVLVNELHRVVQFDFIGVSLRDKNSDTFQDRKSTRLNSSHQIISYAVFCLKKKTQQ